MHAVALAARQIADLLLLVAAAEVEQRAVGAAVDLVLAELDDFGAAEISSHTVLFGSSASRLWSTPASLTVSPRRIGQRRAGLQPVNILNKVVLPAPFRPMTPTMPPGGSLRRQVLDQQLVAETLVAEAFGLDQATLPSRSLAGMLTICVSVGRRPWACSTSSS